MLCAPLNATLRGAIPEPVRRTGNITRRITNCSLCDATGGQRSIRIWMRYPSPDRHLGRKERTHHQHLVQQGERLVIKRLLGILAAVILGLSLGIPAATASTARAANPELATQLSGARIAATPQFLAALKKAREAGRGAVTDDPTGVCWSGHSLCWRDMPSGAIDMWNRDISGDPRQTWEVVYEGTVDQTGCASGIPNSGVYAFIGWNGYYASAGYTTNGGQSYYVGDGTSYDYWAWYSNGALINCADTRNNDNGAYSIPAPPWGEGNQLVTAPMAIYGYTPFQQIHV
jgi:hypothetical protein